MKRCRPKPAVPGKVRSDLGKRSDRECEIRLPDICRVVATDAAHRIGQAQGGPDTLSNVLHACRACHDWCGRNPAKAKLKGWMLHPADKPLKKRVLYRGRWALLTNTVKFHYLPTSQKDELE